MLLTLALVVLIASIAIMFSQEFMAMLKKILAIKGAKLFLPLIMASFLTLNFDYWVLWFIYYFQECLRAIINLLAMILPLGGWSYYVAVIIVLTVISITPVIFIQKIVWKNRYTPFSYPLLTSTFLWVVMVLVLTLA